MFDLVGNPEARFSHITAQMLQVMPDGLLWSGYQQNAPSQRRGFVHRYRYYMATIDSSISDLYNTTKGKSTNHNFIIC